MLSLHPLFLLKAKNFDVPKTCKGDGHFYSETWVQNFGNPGTSFQYIDVERKIIFKILGFLSVPQ